MAVEQGKLRTLYSEDVIKERVIALAEQINRDYSSGDVVLVGILKGAFVFLADLMRRLTVTSTVDFMCLSSYGASTTSSGRVQILKDLELSLEGKDVIIVEDIIDTGWTLQFLREELSRRHPRSLKVCVLLDKKFRREADVEADYVGITLKEDFFVVGYGLDCSERYRYLPGIYCIEL